MDAAVTMITKRVKLYGYSAIGGLFLGEILPVTSLVCGAV